MEATLGAERSVCCTGNRGLLGPGFLAGEGEEGGYGLGPGWGAGFLEEVIY